MEEVVEVVCVVYVFEFVESLLEGFNIMFGEWGVKLLGG